MAININPNPLNPEAYFEMAAAPAQNFLVGQQQGIENALLMENVARDMATRNALAQYLQTPPDQRQQAFNALIAQSPETAAQVFGIELAQNELAMQQRREQALREYTAAEYVLSSETPALALRLLDEGGTFQQQLIDAGLIDPDDGISDEEARLIAQWARDTVAPIAGVQVEAPESPFEKIDPADFTPESIAAFQASGGRDFSLLRPREEEAKPTEFEQKLRTVTTLIGRPLTETEVLRAAGLAPEEGKDVLNEQIPPDRVNRVLLPDGTPVPVGTTWGEAQRMGARVFSEADLKRQQQISDAVHLLDRLQGMAFEDGVFKDAGGSLITDNVLARTVHGIANGIGALVGTSASKRREIYNNMSRGTIGPLIRALGESGALAEGDVKRAIDLLPKLGATPDTEEQARIQFDELREILTRGAMNLQARSGGGGMEASGPIELGGGVTATWID